MRVGHKKAAAVTSLTLSMMLVSQAARSESTPKISNGNPEVGTSSVVVPIEVFTLETVVLQVIEKSSAVITFPIGQSTLSSEEATKLKSFVADMKAQASVEKFVIATWSDKDYPAKGKSLGDADIKIAKNRNESIKSSLDAAGVKNVEYFTMTTQPNWFQRYLSTKTAELKGGASTKILTNESMERVGERLRARGGPSKSVIVPVFENNNLAH